MARNSRENLLKTAIDLFYQKGFADTSIREIGAKAGVSNSLLYHYFKNKEDILFEICDTAAKELMASLREIEDRQLEPLESLREMVMLYMVHFNVRREKESKIFVQEHFWLRGRHRKAIRKIQRDIYDFYKRKYEALAGLGLLNDIHPTVMNFSVFGVITWFFRWYREEGNLTKAQVAEDIMKFIFEGIARPNRTLGEMEFSRSSSDD